MITGDGDIAPRAGGAYKKAREGDGLLQPMTTFFKCLNMDWPSAHAHVEEHSTESAERARKAFGE